MTAAWTVACALLCALWEPATPRADLVEVFKSKRELVLMSHGTVLKKYRVALGGQPVGKKVRQGDRKTPEGRYLLDRRNPHSKFHRSIHISYPNGEDLANARRLRVPPGGDIFLHGLPNGLGSVGAAHRAVDWTDGCIAVTDQEIDEIWNLVADGTPIVIHP
jgi:murein L,D-transpeptidase YafK